MNSLIIEDFTYIPNKYKISFFTFICQLRDSCCFLESLWNLAVISFCSVSVFFFFFFLILNGSFKKYFIRKTQNVLFFYNVGMTSKLPFNISTFLLALLSFQVKNEGDDFGWGVVVNFSKKSNVKVNCCPESKIVYKFLVKCFFRIRKSIRLEIALP